MIGYLARRRQLRQQRRTLLILWTLAAMRKAQIVEIVGVTGLSTAALLSVLVKAEDDGLIYSKWETFVPDRDRRRFYTLTALGERHAAELVPELLRQTVMVRRWYLKEVP